MERQSMDPSLGEAMARIAEWPFDEQLGRIAGQTSQEARDYVTSKRPHEAGDKISGQYVTPDLFTASSWYKAAMQEGRPEVAQAFKESAIEFAEFFNNPTTPYPRPIYELDQDIVKNYDEYFPVN